MINKMLFIYIVNFKKIKLIYILYTFIFIYEKIKFIKLFNNLYLYFNIKIKKK